MTNTFDAANRLISSSRDDTTVQPIYNGVGDRVRQMVGATTTYYTLDVEGLPEVITSDGEIYLHLPGVIVTEQAGQVRYLLGDGLGSIRQAVNETGAVVAYNEYDPYGNPVQEGSQPYGFTGEWWQEELELLHLRARWLMPETGTFLSRDPVESEPPYQYVRGNPINLVDPSGMFPEALLRDSYGDAMVESWKQDQWWWKRMLEARHGDILISSDKQTIAQFVLDDPYLRAYDPPWVLPWDDCIEYKKYPIKLEFFTPNGQFYSTTAAAFAETWRQNTGSFYYTGLRPGQPTWGEYVSGWGANSWMKSYQTSILPIYYLRVLPVASYQTQINIQATAIDGVSTAVQVGETAMIDTVGGVLTLFGCSTGPQGCVAGVTAAGGFNMGESAPSGVIDYLFDLLKLGPTVLSDIIGGETTFVEGKLRIGEGTVHSLITTHAGLIPETHIQLYANSKQLSYDLSYFTGSDKLDTGLIDVKAIELTLP